MARKRSRQPSLFSSDSGDDTTPQDPIPAEPQGDSDAIQDAGPAIDKAVSGISLPAQRKEDAPGNGGKGSRGIGEPPQGMAGATLPGSAGQRPNPDRGSGPGTGSE